MGHSCKADHIAVEVISAISSANAHPQILKLERKKMHANFQDVALGQPFNLQKPVKTERA
jgi:hypothetical protein